MSLVTLSLWYRRVEFSCVDETSKLRGKKGKPSLVSCSIMGAGDSLCTAVEIHCSCLSSRNNLSFSCTEHGCSWQPLEICVFRLFLRFWPKDASEVATSQWLNIVRFQSLFLPHLNVLQQGAYIGLGKTLSDLGYGRGSPHPILPSLFPFLSFPGIHSDPLN